MSKLHTLSSALAIALASAASTLPVPPTSYGVLTEAWGVDPSGNSSPATYQYGVFDLDVWGSASGTITSAELLAAKLHLVTLVDDTVDAVDATDNELDITGHVYKHGDGPVTIASSGTLPGGLVAATQYWIIYVDSDSIALASSLENALAGTKIDLTSAGSGVITLSDVDAATKRVHWHSLGLLNAGTITLDAQRAFTVRISHSPGAIAYAIAGTVSAGTVSAAINPVLEKS